MYKMTSLRLNWIKPHKALRAGPAMQTVLNKCQLWALPLLLSPLQSSVSVLREPMDVRWDCLGNNTT